MARRVRIGRLGPCMSPKVQAIKQVVVYKAPILARLYTPTPDPYQPRQTPENHYINHPRHIELANFPPP